LVFHSYIRKERMDMGGGGGGGRERREMRDAKRIEWEGALGKRSASAAVIPKKLYFPKTFYFVEILVTKKIQS
jgi:hypothetical protein